tara:strand:+ start:271 stop:1998 length:1728 start_codon:yes stop_codon:yes gene_type:complete
MPQWTPRAPRLEYTAKDTIRELSTILLTMALKERSAARAESIRREERALDREEDTRRIELNLLFDQRGETRAERKALERALEELDTTHSSLFGITEEDSTSASKDVVGTLTERLDIEISNETEKIEALEEQIDTKRYEIADINKMLGSLASISKEYGDPEIFDPADFTRERLAETYDIPVDLVGRYLEENPYVFNQKVIESMNLLLAQSIAVVGEREYLEEKREFADETTIVRNLLVNSPYVRKIGALVTEYADDLEGLPEAMMGLKLSTEDLPKGVNIATFLNESGSETERFATMDNTYQAITSFTGDKPDYMGLFKFVNNLKETYDDQPDRQRKEEFRQFTLDLFNIDLTKSDKFMFEDYDPGKREDVIKDFTPESVTSYTFKQQGLYKTKFFKKNKDIKRIFKGYYKDLSDKEVIEKIKVLYDSLPNNPKSKKRSLTVVRKIRSKLVDAGHEIVKLDDIESNSGNAVRMAIPLANKFKVARALLEEQGISIEVEDSYRRWEVQKEAYDKWIAGGKVGPKVAHPDISFHTIGYAFDLAQTNDMKREEVFAALRKVGLKQHPGEWFHWSLEDLK